MPPPRYEILEELSRTDWHVLHRGRRLADARPVLVKAVRRDRAGPTGVDLLEHEHAITRDLSAPGVPRAEELFRHEESTYLVLEDPGGAPLTALLASRRPDLGSFFKVGIRLAAILGELHRRGLVHNGVNPASVFVDPATLAVSLTNLSLAARASGETRAPLAARLLPGALPYMAPEQTGRMNRATDYRADFYSLGVTLYEVLTGLRPFRSDDPLELIHWHIAKYPPPPAEVVGDLPEPVSGIVMKLLAKTAEERYQSALGLRRDLETCEEAWAAGGAVARFPLGQRDVSDRFLIPQRLYGRDREVGELLEAFDRVCEGPPAMLVIAGYSGIGKTSLVQELHAPIVRRRGYFITGKFDPVARSVPYGALTRAFRGLVQQLLAEGEPQLAFWRTRLSEALDVSGGVLTEMIPEMELVIGAQPPAPALGPAESQNRFVVVFRNLLRALATRQHPLVIFLDDLQWADSATLGLLSPLLTSDEIGYLFLIGAYRENEVDAASPLVRALASLEAEGVRLRRTSLGPLDLGDLSLLVGDTLRRDPADAEPLARLVYEKTGGNPFFVIQFLKALEEAGLLTFDDGRGHWTFQMDSVAGAGMTDNVVDLMTRKIHRLSPKAQTALTLGACIGSPFDLSALATISRQAADAAADDLKEALVEGLILPVASAVPRYAFLHDRVQQVAYAMIPDGQKRSVHLTVGRLLLERWDSAGAEERVFDIVNHLNLGRSLITDGAERLGLARLNLVAGRRARSSTAYQAALGYFRVGIGLLPEDCWGSTYELAFALHLEAAECEYLCGGFDTAEGELDRLLDRARSRVDRARAYGLRIVQYENRSRYADAVRVGREGLALFGIAFPDAPDALEAALDAELAAILTLQGARTIGSLLELPTMRDPEMRIVMRLLANLHTPCYLSGDKLLTLLNTATMVRLSLAHGNSEESAHAYVLHAMLLGQVRGEYRSAYEFGTLALRLNERRPDPGLRARILMNFAWAIGIWRRPIRDSIPLTREAFRLASETGLFADAAYALFNETWFTLLSASHLGAVEPVCESGVAFLKRVNMHGFVDAPRVIMQWSRALEGQTDAPTSLTGAGFDEALYRQAHAGHSLFEMFHLVARLSLLYTFGEFRVACDTAREAERVIRDYTGTIWDELRVFHHALALSAVHAELPAEERRGAETALDGLSARLRSWAESSPENFRAQHLLVSAEIARLRRRDAEAMGLYEEAIRAAADQDSPRERALANEVCARFWLARGNDTVAGAYLRQARRRYAEWGAVAKVRALEAQYADLLAARRAEPGEPAVLEPAALDVATVLKSAQAIAEEIVLDEVLRKLMRITIESAGAERGLFLAETGGRLLIEAEATVDSHEVKVRRPASPGEDLPLARSVVQYCRKTGESVIIGDAPADRRFAADPYVVATRPRSILCLPVVHHGRFGGILYLENNLAADAFTADRVQVMHVLSSQAAIAIEKARLYEEMREEVARRTRAEDELRAALAELRQLKDQLQAQNLYLREEIHQEQHFGEIVGSSPALMELFRRVERVAPTDATVLVQGETGTGKELVARAIHERSARKDRPLVKVNCAAISAGLVESELFGHVKGAFTGALDRRVGRFELADGGTIFLDEVGELPPDMQVKLLRVLQEQEFEPVGSSRTVRVDARVIAATNRDLSEAVRAGRFRADLFYRLNVFPLHVPRLGERRGDIPQLVMFFLARFSKRFGKRIEKVSQETMDVLTGYPWPGNIRELQNVIERAVVLADGPVLMLGRDLLPAVGRAAPSGPVEPAEGAPSAAVHGDEARRPQAGAAAPASLEEIESRHILSVLRQTRGVIEGPNGAARILDLHPNTLRSRMKKLGIRRPDRDAS